jgi:ribosomal protein S18 acetylase RimI-like enzyme
MVRSRRATIGSPIHARRVHAPDPFLRPIDEPIIGRYDPAVRQPTEGVRHTLNLMNIRNYRSGDEQAQVELYNAAARSLPAFKAATAEEVVRRYRTTDPDPTTKFYAVEGGEVVGYAVFSPHGRVSYPWCRPGVEAAQPALMEAVIAALRALGAREAWAAYRADWEPVIAFFRSLGFDQKRAMINYVAALMRLPHVPVPAEQMITPLDRSELPRLLALGEMLFSGDHASRLESFFWENALFDPSSLFSLRHRRDESLLGVGVAVMRQGYADPTKIDAAMPCFRLGALGTETERHRRVNGLFSCVVADEAAGDVLLSEAARRFEEAGLTHAAAQAASDHPALVAFYDRHFERQGSFPILAKAINQ